MDTSHLKSFDVLVDLSADDVDGLTGFLERFKYVKYLGLRCDRRSKDILPFHWIDNSDLKDHLEGLLEPKSAPKGQFDADVARRLDREPRGSTLALESIWAQKRTTEICKHHSSYGTDSLGSPIAITALTALMSVRSE